MTNNIGLLKQSPADFIVTEEIDFNLTGEGEHIWLYIEKTGINTKELIKKLAQFCNLPRHHIGYSGLKDKHAITRQWISVYYPGKKEIDFSGFHHPGITLLDITRHHKKLKIGTHKFNRFSLVIREVSQPFTDIQTKLEQIKTNGFLNYYGIQRFGFDNLEKAQQWIAGEYQPEKSEQGFLYSVIRAYLFNAYIDYKKQQNTLYKAMPGDIVGLINSNSFFMVTDETLEDINQRIKLHKLALAGVLVGKEQKLHFQHNALTQYQDFCRKHQQYVDFLINKMDMQFRSTLIIPQDITYEFDHDNHLLKLDFSLPCGSYATSLVDALSHSESYLNQDA
ncbi:tRNA pseudouridine(13) synthase TruD [Facilibium subflavum]|uniref:tRNA pseudouridine(13) synthase TruD n=1 Tax=Facilibium subflavum TaxID=2219058 RepID=UPI000E65CE54|nr:tRNA pseudouridine(13) synthase TruD [Facilibium subflavum]